MNDKEIMKRHCEWIKQQIGEISAFMNLKDSDMRLNKNRELSAISTAMDSLRELELYIKEL